MSDASIRLSRKMQAIARRIDKQIEQAAGNRMSWSLMIWPQVKSERAQYVSNVDRSDAIRALEELLERWKERGPDIPAHKVQ